jgi:polar amino acid transport system permease protein
MSYEWHFEVVAENFFYLVSGLQMTIIICVSSMALAVFLGLVIALARLSGVRLFSALAAAYTEFFRSTPVYTQLIWIYYALPIVTGVAPPSLLTAIIAFALNLAAFLAEIFRAGIMSISKGQREAAFALGMTQTQAMRQIILPQAVTRVLPPLGSMWVSLFKDTSIVAMITVSDLMYRSKVVAVNTYRPLEILTASALSYFVVTYPQSRAVDWLHERLRVHE